MVRYENRFGYITCISALQQIGIIPVNRGQSQYVPLALLYILEFFYPIILLYYLLDQIQFCHRHIGGSRHPLSFRIDS